MKQNALGIGLRSHATFDNFYSGDNSHAVTLLQTIIEPQSESFIYLWGAAESGKSHLLQACCHFASHHDCQALYLPLTQLNDLNPALLENLEQYQLICIDDIEYVIGHSDWQRALFNLYNRLHAVGSHFIITSDRAPTQLTLELADLQSRLTWGVTLHLQPLSQNGRLEALTLHAKARGFELPAKVGNFLLNHYDRSMSALMQALERLDEVSLQQKRKLTIPFVKQTLAI